MDHGPIYRSAENSRPAPLASLVRGASLLSAAAALTISGIALGYHGVASPATETPDTSGARQASIDIPGPMVAFPRVDNGHPDLIAEISSVIVHNVQPSLPPVPVPVPPAPPTFGPAFVLEAPPAFTDPVVVAIEILPVDDVAAAVEDTVRVDIARPGGARARASEPRTFAASHVVDIAGVQEEARAAAADVEPPAAAPAPPPEPARAAAAARVAQPPTSEAAAHISTPEPVRHVVVTPEPKPRVEVEKPAPKPAQVEAPKRTEPQKQEQPKDNDRKPATNQKGDDDGHGKKHG